LAEVLRRVDRQPDAGVPVTAQLSLRGELGEGALLVVSALREPVDRLVVEDVDPRVDPVFEQGRLTEAGYRPAAVDVDDAERPAPQATITRSTPEPTSRAIAYSSSGMPPTGTSGFGSPCVASPIRSAFPPARTSASISARLRTAAPGALRATHAGACRCLRTGIRPHA